MLPSLIRWKYAYGMMLAFSTTHRDRPFRVLSPLPSLEGNHAFLFLWRRDPSAERIGDSFKLAKVLG